MRLQPKLITTVFLLLTALAVLLSYRYESQLKSWPIFHFIINQRQETRQEAKIHKLNLYMIRDYRSLLSNPANNADADNATYISYFGLISDYLPNQADSFQLLGYCYARQNDTQRALENFEHALILNPHYFWSYYDLGLLLWSIGDKSHASVIFEKSLSLSPQETLESISSSKVYMDILGGAPSNYNPVENLKEGYGRTVIFLRMLASGAPAPEISSAVQTL